MAVNIVIIKLIVLAINYKVTKMSMINMDPFETQAIRFNDQEYQECLLRLKTMQDNNKTIQATSRALLVFEGSTVTLQCNIWSVKFTVILSLRNLLAFYMHL